LKPLEFSFRDFEIKNNKLNWGNYSMIEENFSISALQSFSFPREISTFPWQHSEFAVLLPLEDFSQEN
jgi:hypothetical protein